MVRRLMDLSSNLVCGTSMDSLIELNYGLYTHKKINDIYTKNCSNGSTSPNEFDYVLKDISFVGIPYVQSEPFKDSCLNLNKIIARCDNNIASSALSKDAQIDEYYAQYMGKYKNELNTKYKNIVDDRNRLDQHAMKLMGLDKSLYEKQNIVDSAVFTTLLWTALATSVLYYAFTKI